MIATVAVGTDGSGTADEAVTEAAEIARRFGAKLVLLSAFSKGSSAAKPHNVELQWATNSSARVRSILEGIEEGLRKEGIDCETRADEGDAGEVIVRLAEECGADLLVIGNKGMKRRVLGSVPNTVTHTARLLGPGRQDDIGRSPSQLDGWRAPSASRFELGLGLAGRLCRLRPTLGVPHPGRSAACRGRTSGAQYASWSMSKTTQTRLSSLGSRNTRAPWDPCSFRFSAPFVEKVFQKRSKSSTFTVDRINALLLLRSVSSPAGATVNRTLPLREWARKIAFLAPCSGGLRGVTSKHWFR